VVDFQGTKTLEVDIATTSDGGTVGGVSTPLCEGGVSIGGWALSLRVWIAPSNSSQPSVASAVLTAVNALGNTIGTYTGSIQTNKWLTVDLSIDSSVTTEALGIQFTPNVASGTWSGSMYLDDIRLH
jgi:predicted MFS family arabinose efflux permease